MGGAFEILFTPLGCPRIGREIGAIGALLFFVFCMASHILTWVICLQTLSDNRICKMIWGVIALILMWICTWPRTLQKMSYFSIACKSINTILFKKGAD